MEVKLAELRKSEEQLRLRLVELEQLEQLAHSLTVNPAEQEQENKQQQMGENRDEHRMNEEQAMKNTELEVEKKAQEPESSRLQSMENHSEQELKSQVL